MKRCIFFFFIFLTSVSLFFSFKQEVKADTINYYLYTSTDFDVVDEFLSYKSDLESYLSSHNLSSNYYVFLETQTSNVFKVGVNPNHNNQFYLTSNAISLINYNRTSYLNIDRSTGSISTSDYNSRWQVLPIYYNNISSASATPRYFIYANVYITIPSFANICTSSDDIVYILDDKSFTQSCSSSDFHILSLYELDEIWNSSPPTPPDDTPVLTSFVNLVIIKLSYICEFFTSSYIFLSIFVILILYISILLLRRLL